MRSVSMDHPLANWFGNVVSAGAILGTLIGWLPAFAAVVGAIFYVIQIWESKTVQDWVRARRTRKLARMKAAAIMLEAQLRHPETPASFAPRDL